MTGGTDVHFYGYNFVNSIHMYKIMIDGRVCNVTAASPDHVTCVTDKRPGLVEPSLEIMILGKGLVSN